MQASAEARAKRGSKWKAIYWNTCHAVSNASGTLANKTPGWMAGLILIALNLAALLVAHYLFGVKIVP